jgi:hypothetical protein
MSECVLASIGSKGRLPHFTDEETMFINSRLMVTQQPRDGICDFRVYDLLSGHSSLNNDHEVAIADVPGPSM